MQDLVKVGEI